MNADIYTKKMVSMLANRYVEEYRKGGAAGAASFSEEMLTDSVLRSLVKKEVKNRIKRNSV